MENMSLELHQNNLKIAILKDRAAMLKKSRDYFYEQGIIEVDCPIISRFASIDAHIDLIPVLYENREKRYLHSSPEFGMKKLLSEGMGDIFQLSHVFRDEEYGSLHNPEFMMAEWYRLGFTLPQMIEDTARFIQLFLGNIPYQVIHYRNIFQQVTQIDYVQASKEELLSYIEEQNIPCHKTTIEGDKDSLLHLILAFKIEPLLGQGILSVLGYYPASQSALARKEWIGDEEVAERFEFYFQGIELANGYHELTDVQEQRLRFDNSNLQRESQGKEKLPIDENFLLALEKGLPDCCGVAVGIDRLMMLRHHKKNIGTILPFAWDIA